MGASRGNADVVGLAPVRRSREAHAKCASGGGRYDQIENARDEFGDIVTCFLTRGSAYATDPDAALQAMKSQVYSTGPNGEKASPA
jgi:hypothetical protein